jgi:hypothetical protein
MCSVLTNLTKQLMGVSTNGASKESVNTTPGDSAPANNSLPKEETVLPTGALPPREAAPLQETLPGDLAAITWTTNSAVNPNLVMTANDDGTTTFRRSAYAVHDAALGQELKSGRHEWIVTAPNNSANIFAGVAAAKCNTRIYPAATTAWAFHFQDGKLSSGACVKGPPLASKGKSQGTEGLHAAAEGKSVMDSGWIDAPVRPRGTPVRIILDMEERSLSIAIGDAEPQLAFTSLPRALHPYICSGDNADNSVVVVHSAPLT